MTNRKQVLLAVLCATIASASSVKGEEIKLMIGASPWEKLNRVTIVSGGATKPLLGTLTSDQLVPIQVPPNNERFKTDIVGEWKEQGAQGVPFFRLSAFSSLEEPLEVYFIQEAVKPEDNANSAYVNDHCDGEQPDGPREAFTQIAECAPVANYYRATDQTDKKNYFKALNGWFVANYYLYAGLDYKFHPFGLDSDLVSHIKGISERVAAGRPASNFSPLRIDDINAALRERRAEPIRMVSLVPTLASQGHFGPALKIAQAGLENYDELVSGQRANAAIFGTTRSMLEMMVSDLENILSRPGNAN